MFAVFAEDAKSSNAFRLVLEKLAKLAAVTSLLNGDVTWGGKLPNAAAKMSVLVLAGGEVAVLFIESALKPKS